MEDPAEIIKIIKRIQLSKDKKAKVHLLAKYYDLGCRWARSIIKNILYSDLIAPSDAEIGSLVYQSFEKAVNNIKVDTPDSLSFKNFFYLMIKYQVYKELKTTLNCHVVPNYSFEAKQLDKEMKEEASINSEQAKIRELDYKHRFEEVIEFLESKNSEYATILILKSQGYKNKEICKRMALSELSLKSRLQYIKKLVRNKFSQNPQES